MTLDYHLCHLDYPWQKW